jgi:ribose 5-phosphate isomerase A
MTLPDAERMLRLARRAADEVQPGMLAGLGSGSTAEALVAELGRRVAAGLRFTGVATSIRTRTLAESLGIPIMPLDEVETLDVCIDGADEIAPDLNVVKGRGGALLYEKLVAVRARRYVIIAAAEKLVAQLGTRMPLPVEVIPYGWARSAQALEPLGLKPTLRAAAGQPFVTDGGHYIVDCATGPIAEPAQLAQDIKALTGIVDHGLFIGLADAAMTIDDAGELAVQERAAR